MTFHETLMNQMKTIKTQLSSQGVDLALPPPSMIELKMEYTALEPGVLLAAKFPFQKRFTNPVGLYQGGILAAAMDDIFGPPFLYHRSKTVYDSFYECDISSCLQ
jgi:acyl-coenzyme A thioesterase PaaI-like protein